ncbi:MAG: sigma-54 dependent transcriptional regulator [Planctomycetota bacterium]|nr:sigma-54 dependent transcriptional regulator [Planctomycetota bacterium]
MTRDGRILIVEDEASQRRLLKTLLEGRGFEVDTAGSVAEAAEALARQTPDVLLTDYNMDDGNGVDVLKQARSHDPDLGVVLITAYGTVPMAVEAMREGAVDVLLKPVDPDALLEVIGRALRLRNLSSQNAQLRARLHEQFQSAGVVARSAPMQALLKTALRIAPTKASVLVTGESGTGKELIANLLHEEGTAPEGPFVATHCAALPESLLESELFGHAQGAFTGAVADRKGRFEEAHGGTLFLDEIGEIPPAVQVRLLRVLQEREIVRVGENHVRPIQVRLVAATNRDLEAEVAAGRFREDLFYRINVVHLHVPPLRERPEDLPELIAAFTRDCVARDGMAPLPFAEDALQALAGHAFPGNVRELRNVVERALLLAPGEAVTAADLPGSVRGGAEDAHPEAEGLEGAVLALETRMIREALARADGVQTRAAALLGVAERVLRYKMKKYGIERPDRRS